MPRANDTTGFATVQLCIAKKVYPEKVGEQSTGRPLHFKKVGDMSSCPLTDLRPCHHDTKVQRIFSACRVWPRLGPPMAVLQ